LSDYDKAIFYSSIHQFTKQKCETKIQDLVYKQKKTHKEANEFITKLSHCKKITDKALFRANNYEYYTCSCTHASTIITSYFRLYNAYKNGILPFVGGYYEQPALFEDIIAIMQEYETEQEELAKKNKK